MPLYHTGKAGKKPGRPKKLRDIDATLSDIIDEPIDGQFMSKREAVARVPVDIALDPKANHVTRLNAAQFIFERQAGKPKQRIETAEAPNLELVIEEETDEPEAGDEPEGAGGNG
jgi:hypothetical protein